MDGNETDVDCGGPECAPCLPGENCKVDTDCASESCNNGTYTCGGSGFYDTGGNVSQRCVCNPGFSGTNCGISPLILPSSNTAALAAEIGTGALAGLVLGICLCVGLSGAGGYAAYTKMQDGPDASVQSNPLYKAAGTGGVNPLHHS